MACILLLLPVTHVVLLCLARSLAGLQKVCCERICLTL